MHLPSTYGIISEKCKHFSHPLHAQGLSNLFNNRQRMNDKEIRSQGTPWFYPTRGDNAILVRTNAGEVPSVSVEFHGHVNEVLRNMHFPHAGGQLCSWHTVECTLEIKRKTHPSCAGLGLNALMLLVNAGLTFQRNFPSLSQVMMHSE